MPTHHLHGFDLAWRWTDGRYRRLPEVDLARIHPLSAPAACAAWAVRPQPMITANRLVWGDTEAISTQCPEAQDISAWLTVRIAGASLTVAWRNDLAITTDAKLFIRYWDDFCYPASDDVTIWPEHADWILHYDHQERFRFARATRG